LGGNDLEGHAYRTCSAEATSFDGALSCLANATARVTACTEALLAPLWAKFPHTRVMQCGYDVPCVRGRCAAVAGARAPYCMRDGALNVSCGNQITVAWQPMLLGPLAAKYPTRYTGIDVLGTVQQAGGVAGAAVGAPNLDEGSPCGLMKWCVHPQYKGATAVGEAFWDLYYGKPEREARGDS
jgi:hypothetical protein